MWFFSLIGGAKGIAVIAVVLALGGYIWKLKSDTKQVQQQLVVTTAQRDAAGVARDQAIAANATNLAAIGQLQKERDDVQIALNNLEATRKQDVAKIDQLRASIRTQAFNPANKATLSPVLADTVKQIQTLRAQRRAGAAQ